MAFDANIIVINKQYKEQLHTLVMEETHTVLQQFNIIIEREVSMQEYEDMTSSKEINRYIRVTKANLSEQKQAARELVKVGVTRYQTFERFASAKYAFFSISQYEHADYTVIWFSFHSRLYRVFQEFNDFSFNLARNLSVRLQAAASVLSASSFSRNADKFIMYIKGKERNKLSSKGALTKVRDLYGLDINTLMISVDKNMGIYYAPTDYKTLRAEIVEQKNRYAEWNKRKVELHKNEHGTMIENKTDGSEYIDVFEKENEMIMKNLDERLAVIENALHADPIGSVIYFKMTDKGSDARGVPVNEREFGRDVTCVSVSS